NGDADAIVAGKDRDSQDVIFAMKTLAGFAPGIQTFSAAQLYSTPYRNVGTDGVFMLADITTNQNPDADVLVQIAVNTVKSVRRLVDPKVRLAFVFGKGEGSQKIQQAIAAARAKFDELGIEAEIAGEPLTVDEALRRGYNGLIGPDLDTANPLYKNFQWLGGYTPLSLTTGGAGKIILDLSRGAGADEIEATMEVAAVLAGAGDPERAEQREVSEQAVPVTGPEYVLVINAGSSSVKWKYYRMPSEEVLGKDEIQNIGQFGHPATHEEAFAEIAQKIQVLKLPLPQGIGHRVVLGGDLSDSSEITPEIDALIQKYFKEAPLHNPPNHAGYKAAQRSFPGIPNVAVFDTSFHAFKKLTAWLYPVGRSLAQKLGLRRYGFHGTSYRYIMTILPDMLGKGANEINAIIFHLGNGSSGTRIENGIAVDTTMGLFPNEGVMMGTRSGSLPSPLALFAAQQFKKEQEAKLAPWKNWLRRFFPFLFRIDFEKIMDEVIRFFDKGSGVQGISGLSYDMRKLLAELGLEQTDDPDEIRSAIRRIHEVLSGPRPDADEAAAKRWDCALAIDMYAESVASAIGQYYVKMDRVDVLAFTGGIGSRNGIVRQMILDLLKQIKTRQIVIPTDGDIPSRYARVLEQIRQLEPGVIPVLFPETDEEIMIARDTYRILSKANRQELKSEGEKQRAESRADAVALASQLTLTGPIRTVMVLEDQAGLRAGVVGLIERDFPGLQVIPVADGREGLAHPQLDSVDLFVTDLSMPGMDGWEFIRRIRQAGKQTPIYVYSGSYLDPATRDLGNIAGSMAVQPHLVIKSLLARSEMRDQQLEKTAFDVMKATGWQPNDRVRVILVSDNTGTLTEKTDIPIQGEMLDGLRDFLAHPDNILVVNSGDADTEMNKAHRPFFDGSQALTFEQRSRYHRIAGSGKIRRGYKPENGSIAYQAVLEDWPVSDRLRYARTIMEAFFSELKQRTAQPGNLFARVFEDSGAEGIEAAYQDALRRFHVIEEEGTWGTSDDRYVFELFPGELGRRIGNPYLYDLGSSMCLELQDTFAVLNKIAPGQKDTFQLAFSVEMAMRRQFPGHESLNFSSTPTASALSKITKATAVDQTLREILTVLEPSLAADEKVLILYMGDGRNDIPTFGLNLNTARIASAAFYLNHQPEDAERLPPGTYVTEGERLDGGLQVLQFANAISGKRVADMAPFSARQWKPAERREQRGKAERPKPKEKVQSPNRTEGKASGNFGRAELRDLAPQHGVGNKKTKNAGGIDSVLAIRERVKSLTGRFTVAVDLAEFAALEEAQRLEYETFLVQNKNIALAAYHSGVEVDPAVRSRLEWLQEKLGYDRVVFSPQGPGEIFSKYAQFGKVIHLSMTQNTKLLGDLVDLAQKDSRIYLFRYLGDETGLLTAALLLADAEDPTARGRVVDFSMISSVLRNQITQYLASLSFASAA
ncbi:MAG: phosphate acyltransferase, partial [Candidatus Omnitrophota bacterium]